MHITAPVSAPTNIPITTNKVIKIQHLFFYSFLLFSIPFLRFFGTFIIYFYADSTFFKTSSIYSPYNLVNKFNSIYIYKTSFILFANLVIPSYLSSRS